MACKISSLLLAHVFIVTVLLAISEQGMATRDIPKNDDQMKQPEFLNHDRSVLIPGFGRVMLPPVFKHRSTNYGSTSGGHIGSTIGGSSQIPGGDDTLVPNPGFEVPIPAGGGAGNAGTYPHP